MDERLAEWRIPKEMHAPVAEILALTDAFCAQHLDAEYGELCGKMVAKLARKRPSPLARGDRRVWAGGVIWALGGVNFLFDRTQKPHLTGDDLSRLIGVPKSTLGNKARTIRDALNLRLAEPEFCRRELLAHHPWGWYVMVNGLIVDARTLPPEIQAEARRRGLIPDLPPGDYRQP